MAAELRFRQKEVERDGFRGCAARLAWELIGPVTFLDAACFECDWAAGDVARKGNRMKTILALLVLCVFTQDAFAKGPECRAIESTSGRLACYDAASPPKIEKPAIVENDVSRAAYKDPFLEEDARTTAKLKNICRGC